MITRDDGVEGQLAMINAGGIHRVMQREGCRMRGLFETHNIYCICRRWLHQLVLTCCLLVAVWHLLSAVCCLLSGCPPTFNVVCSDLHLSSHHSILNPHIDLCCAIAFIQVISFFNYRLLPQHLRHP
jgi:hypothetical protein